MGAAFGAKFLPTWDRPATLTLPVRPSQILGYGTAFTKLTTSLEVAPCVYRSNAVRKATAFHQPCVTYSAYIRGHDTLLALLTFTAR